MLALAGTALYPVLLAVCGSRKENVQVQNSSVTEGSLRACCMWQSTAGRVMGAVPQGGLIGFTAMLTLLRWHWQAQRFAWYRFLCVVWH